MSTIRQILRMHARNKSMQSIMDTTGVSRNTLRKYLKKFNDAQLSMESVSNMGDKELCDLFVDSPKPEHSAKVQILLSLMPKIERELSRPGVTLERLWKEYSAQHPDGFKVTQFRVYYRKWKAQNSPTMHIEHKAGDKVYVDFTGEKLSYTDPFTGEICHVEVFVSILGASQLIYVEAVLSQKKEDFINACRNALQYYGGSPDAIVPDNLRSAVSQSHRYEPEINRAFEDFARYYGMSVIPARAYKPRDKALVEGAVRIVYARIFAHYRNATFSSLQEVNDAIWLELDNLNQTAFKGRDYSRRDLFNEIERDELAPLPRVAYEIRTESRATVMKNGHVALAVDKHYYSVPYRFIGCKVKLMSSATRVDIYYLHECIATHLRERRPFGYSTCKDHLASTHKAMSDWSAEYFLTAAKEIGPEVQLYIGRIFELRQHPEQAFRSCQGVLSFARRVGNDRLRKACARALDYGSYSYRTIKTILEKGLDSAEDGQDSDSGTVPEHDNIRGTDYYKRFDPNGDDDDDDDNDNDNETGEMEVPV